MYSYELTGLESGAMYSVEIASISDVEEDPAASITVTNPVFTIFTPDPVSNLGINITTQAVIVSWGLPPGSENYSSLLQITNFTLIVLRIREDTTVTVHAVIPLSSDRRDFALTVGVHIDVGTEYRADVHASNAAGTGQVASTNTFIPGDYNYLCALYLYKV